MARRFNLILGIRGSPKDFTPRFDTFVPMGSKEAKAVKGEAVDAIFKTYSNGVKTSRDAWVYNFNRNMLAENMNRMIETYNAEVFDGYNGGRSGC